jgi:hypothetical protein
MGYTFTWDKPADDAVSGYALNNYQMNYVRLIMIESGAIAGDGLSSPEQPKPGLETSAETLPAKKFMSNDGWHITAPEAGFVAARLRRAVELDVVDDLLMFFDHPPDDLQVWVEEFAAFAERAAERNGFYVS